MAQWLCIEESSSDKSMFVAGAVHAGRSKTIDNRFFRNQRIGHFS